MDLKGLKVLVDGFNLEMPNGTGIKTYGMSLLAALKAMGTQVGMLSSKCYKVDAVSDQLLDEILFFDVTDADTPKKFTPKIVRKMQTTLTIAKPFRRASEVRRTHTVVTRGGEKEFLSSVGLYGLHECYSVANRRYKLGLGATTISVPGKIALWHATYPLPIRIKGAKKITTIHDIIPLKLPYATLDNKKAYYKLLKTSIKDSDLIITISEHTKKDILSIFDVAPEKIFVTYQPVHQVKPTKPSEAEIYSSLKRYGLKKGKYILFVGTIEPKKNIGRLLDAYGRLSIGMPLVIVGRKGWLWADELENKEMHNVKILENVSRRELPFFYAGAYCLVFPSIYEGFGLPPLEAMSFGCPVITSNVASLPEVCGNAALYTDPYDVSSLKDAIEGLILNPVARERFARAGMERAALFSMEKYKERLYDAYKKVL